MYLKKYQQKVVSELKQFFTSARQTRDEFETIINTIPEAQRSVVAANMNYVESTFQKLNLPYSDNCKNGLGKYYPRINLKIPTGGGKTVLAVEAIKEYQSVFAQKKTGLVVWIVPKEIIYKQTVNNLRDKSHPYRQLLDQASGGRTVIAEKGHTISKQDVEENLVILFLMAQSTSRSTNESLRVFKDSGGFDSFFPEDNRYDLHYQWIKEVPNLDVMWNNGEQAQLITSLGNAVRVSKPFIIIDEFHKVFTKLSKDTIDSLNPEMILGLSATPKEGMNNLCTVTGLDLKEEEMVKLDLHIIPPVGNVENDWKAMLQNIMEKRQSLEDKAIELSQETGQYIRPIALIQCERTGKDQRGKGFVHSEDVKEHLMDEGVNPSEIAIKSSDKNDIEDINLFSRDCQIRYIITQSALNEGWDCSFAYVLGIIPNVNSNTGVTQLIGRILRQPNAKKTGVKELDESYVYYSKGDTSNLLETVVKSFEEEGLGDLVTGFQVQNDTKVNPKKTVGIREEFKPLEYAFYLPVWVMVDDKKNLSRKFNYAIDIKQHITFENLGLSDELLTKIKNSLSEQKSDQSTFSITIDKESGITSKNETVSASYYAYINIGYLSRRLGEFIENPFLARKKAGEWIEALKIVLGEETLKKFFSFISSQLAQYAEEHKQAEEERIFNEYLSSERLKLAVTDDPNNGFRVPETDSITISRIAPTLRHNLYEDVDFDNLNKLERDVVNILERQETIMFWFRNRVARGWYAIQGWRENKIRPDFVVAKKKDDNKVEIVYLMESKGEHLLGNNDTTYKNKVFEQMTAQHKAGKLKTYQTEFDFGVVNEAIEAYLIEGGKEEQKIRELMK
jgi:type III restriction enzyme